MHPNVFYRCIDASEGLNFCGSHLFDIDVFGLDAVAFVEKMLGMHLVETVLSQSSLDEPLSNLVHIMRVGGKGNCNGDNEQRYKDHLEV